MGLKNLSTSFSAILRTILLLWVQNIAWLQASRSDNTPFLTTRQTKAITFNLPTTQRTSHGVMTTPADKERKHISSGHLQSVPGNIIPTMVNQFEEVSVTTKDDFSFENTQESPSNNFPAELNGKEGGWQTAGEPVTRHQTNNGFTRFGFPTVAKVSLTVGDTLINTKTTAPTVKELMFVSDHVTSLVDIKNTNVTKSTFTTAKHFTQLQLHTTGNPKDEETDQNTNVLNTDGKGISDCLGNTENENVVLKNSDTETSNTCKDANVNPGIHGATIGSIISKSQTVAYQLREFTTKAMEGNFISELSELCPFTDICKQLNESAFKMSEPCCRPCSCENDCHKTGNCCFKNGTSIQRPDLAKCLPVQPSLPGKLLSTFRKYRIVNECPQKPLFINTFFPHQVQPNKERDVSREEMEQFSPVFSAITNVTYHNKYVASCHKQSNATLIPWLHLAVCSVDAEQTYGQIQRQLQHGECDIIFTPPADYDLSDQRCYNVDISECNVTGKWNFYDQSVEAACNTLNFPYIQPAGKHTPPFIYANVFCYLCNNRQGVKARKLCPKSFTGQWTDDAVTTTIILSYHEYRLTPVDISVPTSNGESCDSNQIFDQVKDSCVNVECPIGSYRNSEGSCDYVPPIIYSGFASLYVSLRRFQGDFLDIQLSENEFSVFSRKVKNLVNTYRGITWCRTGAFLKYINNSVANPTKMMHLMYLKLENITVTHLFQNMKHMLKTSVELVVNEKVVRVELDLSHSSLSMTKQALAYKFSSDIAPLPDIQPRYKHLFVFPGDKSLSECSGAGTPVFISKLSWCPQVILQAEDYVPENTVDGSRIFLQSRNKSTYHFMLDLNGKVRVCVEDFLNIENGSKPNISDTQVKGQENNLPKTLSIISLFVEATSLIFTLIALCLFHKFRSNADMQEIHLVTVLLLAHFFQWISMESEFTGTLCQFVGLLKHFFSLSAQFITWMACHFPHTCIHSSFRPASTLQRKLHHMIVTHGLATVLVGLNVAIAFHYSRHEHFGYGTYKKMCFIDNVFRYILTLLIPNVIVSTINLIPFLAFLFERKQRLDEDRYSKSQKKAIPAYSILSWMIFATWLCNILRTEDSHRHFYVFLLLSCMQCIFLAVYLVVMAGKRPFEILEVDRRLHLR